MQKYKRWRPLKFALAHPQKLSYPGRTKDVEVKRRGSMGKSSGGLTEVYL